MDWLTAKKYGMEYIKKFRYVLLVLLVGIFLMVFPEKKETDVETQELQAVAEEESSLQDSLASILSQIDGAGKCRVLLTQAQGEQTIYQTDEDISSEDVRRDTVIINGTDREEKGLVKQVNPPVYQGAIVLCQGANNASVRLSIVEAVMSVTGLTSDRITVLKMK